MGGGGAGGRAPNLRLTTAVKLRPQSTLDAQEGRLTCGLTPGTNRDAKIFVKTCVCSTSLSLSLLRLQALPRPRGRTSATWCCASAEFRKQCVASGVDPHMSPNESARRCKFRRRGSDPPKQVVGASAEPPKQTFQAKGARADGSPRAPRKWGQFAQAQSKNDTCRVEAEPNHVRTPKPTCCVGRVAIVYGNFGAHDIGFNARGGPGCGECPLLQTWLHFRRCRKCADEPNLPGPGRLVNAVHKLGLRNGRGLLHVTLWRVNLDDNPPCLHTRVQRTPGTTSARDHRPRHRRPTTDDARPRRACCAGGRCAAKARKISIAGGTNPRAACPSQNSAIKRARHPTERVQEDRHCARNVSGICPETYATYCTRSLDPILVSTPISVSTGFWGGFGQIEAVATKRL